MTRLYLDNCASTPPAPEVVQAMAGALAQAGNPSSIHREGQHAARRLAEARQVLAESLGARPAEIVFCGSGTEANNLAVSGLISRALRERGRARIVTSSTEHASIRTRLQYEKRRHGDAVEIVEVGVDTAGMLRLDQLSAAIDDSTTLVALLLVNNETGIVQSLDALKQVKFQQPGVPWLLDAVQAQGKVDLDTRLLPFEMLSFSAHKIYGPAGVGTLFVRGGTDLDPLVVGGAQEKYRHAGTENLAGIAGAAAAVQLLPPSSATHAHLSRLEDIFLAELALAGPFTINGPQHPVPHAEIAAGGRLPGFLNLSFEGLADRGDLQIALDLAGIALSSTSACHSGVSEESRVLAAMGLSGPRRSGAIRLLFSRYHTEDDAGRAGQILARTVNHMRQNSDSSSGLSLA